MNIIRNVYEEEKRILVVNVYFLIKMEGKNEEVTFWNNLFSVGDCSSYSNDGTGRCTH